MIVDLLSYAPDYEDVIFNGEKDDIRLLRSRGFQFDFERNGFAIARFVGCPAELEIDDGTGGRVLAAVEVRWHPNGHPIQVTELAPAPGRVLAIPGSPCGEVWVRVLFDRDGSHGPTKGDQVCAGSRPDGMVRFEIPAPGTRLRCSAGAPPR